jgi:DNA-directed RNA polymerase subunit beta'
MARAAREDARLLLGRTIRERHAVIGTSIAVARAGEGGRAADGRADRPARDILRVRGEKELQRYLVDEIQEMYRLQGVTITASCTRTTA